MWRLKDTFWELVDSFLYVWKEPRLSDLAVSKYPLSRDSSHWLFYILNIESIFLLFFAIFNYYECLLHFVTEPVLWDENVKLENMKQYMLNHQAYWELARRIQVYITVWPSNQCATVGIDFIFLNPGSLICDNGQEQLALSEIHKLILCWEDCWLRMSLNGLAVKSL